MDPMINNETLTSYGIYNACKRKIKIVFAKIVYATHILEKFVVYVNPAVH